MTCNAILADVIAGSTQNTKKQKYPARGEVDMIVGGPPCQRVLENTVNFGTAWWFLSFHTQDYYRPRFFLCWRMSATSSVTTQVNGIEVGLAVGFLKWAISVHLEFFRLAIMEFLKVITGPSSLLAATGEVPSSASSSTDGVCESIQ